MADRATELNAWEKDRRAGTFQRDPELEAALKALNERLRNAPAREEAHSGHPMVFILGCARSGSTLLLQWLAASERFCYPTNIMSRFYGDLYVGALAHKVLYEHDRKGEIFPERSEAVTRFRSTLGRAQGPAEPHDLGYFWKSYFSFGSTQADLTETPSPDALMRLRSDLEGVRSVFGRPMVMKALQMNWQLPTLHTLFPDALFLVTKRDEYDNALSLLEARRSFFGDPTAWFSFKPAEYERISTLEPFQQTLAQVRCTDRAITNQLKALPNARVLQVDYKVLCEDPGQLFGRIAGALGVEPSYAGPASFPYSTSGTIEERAAASEFLKTWEGSVNDPA